MIIEPKVREFICTTAHPQGCQENVKRQIEYIKQLPRKNGPKNILVIGGSTGYGLASRIASTYTFGANTIGIMFEKQETDKRTATPGYYNTIAFEKQAISDGYYAKSINGDAFSRDIKNETIQLIKKDLGTIDLVIYSLAAPRRTDENGDTYKSVLKTVNEDFTNKSLNLKDNTVSEATITPATKEEIDATVKVMGGEDWILWIDALSNAGVLANQAVTIAYSYVGPKLTYPVYFNGTIGLAKKDLSNAVEVINNKYSAEGIKAYISVNKALVTQASSAIPIVPLYMCVLYKVMKDMNIHEGCIEQIGRLFQEKLKDGTYVVDSEGKIRLDDWEMKDEVQNKVMDFWKQVNSDNINQFADIDGYWEDFYHMFGFKFDNVDYNKETSLTLN